MADECVCRKSRSVLHRRISESISSARYDASHSVRKLGVRVVGVHARLAIDTSKKPGPQAVRHDGRTLRDTAGQGSRRARSGGVGLTRRQNAVIPLYIAVTLAGTSWPNAVHRSP